MAHKAYKPGHAPANYNFEEYCSICDTEIPIVIDENEFKNYAVTCPECGAKLMLCTLCRWDQETNNPRCDWTAEHGCFREEKEDGAKHGVQTQNP